MGWASSRKNEGKTYFNLEYFIFWFCSLYLEGHGAVGIYWKFIKTWGEKFLGENTVREPRKRFKNEDRSNEI